MFMGYVEIMITINLFEVAFCISQNDENLAAICSNEGFLTIIENSVKCECLHQYYVGDKCEIMRVHCKPYKCKNGGRCENYIGISTCDCPKGFYGTECEFEHPNAPFTSNPRLALPHVAHANEPFKIYIVFNNIYTKTHNVTLRIELNISNKKKVFIILPEDKRKFMLVENAQRYLEKLGLHKFDIHRGSAYLYKHFTKFETSGVFNITLTMSMSDGNEFYRRTYGVTIISDPEGHYAHNEIEDEPVSKPITLSKNHSDELLPRRRRIPNDKIYSVKLDCSGRRRNHLINKAETIAPYITTPNETVQYYWRLRYAFECVYFLKDLNKKNLCQFDDRRCDMVRTRCLTHGLKKAQKNYGTSLVEVNYKKSLYIKPFKIPLGNRYRILPDTEEEFLNPMLTIKDGNEKLVDFIINRLTFKVLLDDSGVVMGSLVMMYLTRRSYYFQMKECLLPMVTLNTVPWSHYGRVVSETSTNKNVYTSEHFIYPWLRWASAMHRYDVGEYLGRLQAHKDEKNPPTDLMDYDRLPVVVMFLANHEDRRWIATGTMTSGNMANRVHDLDYGTATSYRVTYISYMSDNLALKSTRNSTRHTSFSTTIMLFRDVFIPRMRIRITRNFHRLATTSDVMEVYLYCKYPWLSKNEPYPPACKFYEEKVWWTVTPEIPISTDRTQVYISTHRRLATPARKYTFRARARWQYNRFYSLQTDIYMSPSFDSPLDPVVNSLERDYTLFNEYTVCFYDPVWHVREDTGAIQQEVLDVTSVILKVYQENVLLTWMKRESKVKKGKKEMSQYLCRPNFMITDASLSPNYTAVYDVVNLDTYGQPTRARVFLEYHHKEPWPISYAFNKMKTFLDKFRKDYPLSVYSDLNKPEAGLIMYSQLLTLRKMHYFSQSTAESMYTQQYRNEIHDDVIKVMDTMNYNGIRESEQILTLCTYIANTIMLTEPVELLHIERIAKIYDKILFFLLKILGKPDPIQIGMATGNIIEIVNPIFRVFEEILFQVPECKSEFCDLPLQCYGEGDYGDYFQMPIRHITPMKNTALIFYKIVKSVFSILVYYIESEQEPYWWSSTRKLMAVTFVNRAPDNQRQFSLFYAPGFRARIPLMSKRQNHAFGLITFKRNVFIEEADCRINTTVNILFAFADPASHRVFGGRTAEEENLVNSLTFMFLVVYLFLVCAVNLLDFSSINYRFPYFGPLTVKHRLLDTYTSTSWFAMKVVTPSANRAVYRTGITERSGVVYYKILSTSRFIEVNFQPRRKRASYELKVAFSQWRHPTVEELFLSVTTDGMRVIIPKLQYSGPLIYMGMKSLEPDTPYNFSIYTLDCLSFDLHTADWTSEFCVPEEDMRGADMNLYAPHYVGCRCNIYNGIFGGHIQVTYACRDQYLDLSGLYALYKTIEFDDYWPCLLLILCVTISILLAYLVALIYTFVTRKNRQVFHFRDNNLIETYPYSVAVETDFRPKAGTTSNILLQVLGTEGTSMPFLLKEGYHRVLQPGLVIYFIMMTDKSLGNILCIRLTSDFSGSRPSWFCRSITICDLQRGEGYLFYVNRWFCLVRNVGLCAEVPVVCPAMLPTSAALTTSYFIQYLREDHPFLGPFLRHPRSVVSASQHIAVTGAVACFIILQSTVFIKMWNPTEEDMLSVENSLSPSFSAVMAMFFAITGLLLNFTLLFLFRTAGPRPTIQYNSSKLEEVSTYISVYENKVFVGHSTKPTRPMGGVSYKCMYRVCCPPIIGKKAEIRHRKEHLKKLYARKELNVEKTECILPNLSWLGWVLSLLIIAVSILTSLLICMLSFTEDRSIEVVYIFMFALLFNIILLEPFILFMMSLITSRLLQERPDQSGWKHKLLIPKFRVPQIALRRVMKRTYVNLRKYNPAYRQLEDENLAVQLIKLRHEVRVVIERGPIMGSILLTMFIFYLAWSVSYDDLSFGYKSTHDVFIKAKYHGIPAKESISKNDVDLYIEHTLYRSIRPDLCDSFHLIDLDWLSDRAHKVLGLPRLRQMRLARFSCLVREPFKPFEWQCNEWFSIEHMSSKNFLPHWLEHSANTSEPPPLSPFIFENEFSTSTRQGFAGDYPYGGYTALIPMKGPYTWLMLKSLNDNKWIDVQTRAVIFEAALYNTDANFVSYIVVLIERLPTGQFIISHKIRPAHLTDKLEDEDSVLLFRIITSLMLFIFAVHFAIKLLSSRLNVFWKSVWNIVDTCMLLLGIFAAISYCCRCYYAKYSLEWLSSLRGEQYNSLQYAIMFDEWYHHLIAWLIFFGLIRVVKTLLYIEFYVIVGLALKWAALALRSFVIMGFVLYMGFTVFAYIILSDNYEEFSTIWRSLQTCITMTFGYFPVSADNLEHRGGYMSLVMYGIFVLTMTFFLLNVFVAILASSFQGASCTIVPFAERRKRRMVAHAIDLGFRKLRLY